MAAKIEKYPIHEYAGLVPMATKDEQAALNLDIAENGLKEPIVLWKGQVVDGRCRQIACNLAGERIRVKELDDDLTDDEVKSFVKSVNTRRNLSMTQKIMSACRQKLDPSVKGTIEKIAESWGISKSILNNALYIARQRPEFIDPLFNGKSVDIVDKNGKEVSSTKVTAIFAFLKRMEEGADEDNQHAWNPDSYIKTQRGKEWYYDMVRDISDTKMMQMKLAELANYKFTKKETI